MLDGRCGSCTACCFFTEIPELEKTVNVWCTHCVQNQGCSVYDTRPASCRKFECYWYSHPELPEDLRPDRCGVMFEALSLSQTLVACVDFEHRLSWKQGSVKMLLTQLAQADRSVLVVVGREKHVFLPSGRTSEEVLHDVQQEVDFQRKGK